MLMDGLYLDDRDDEWHYDFLHSCTCNLIFRTQSRPLLLHFVNSYADVFTQAGSSRGANSFFSDLQLRKAHSKSERR